MLFTCRLKGLSSKASLIKVLSINTFNSLAESLANVELELNYK